MKSYKKIMPIFLIAIFVLTIVYSIQSKMTSISNYDIALEKARDYAEKGIIEDSIEQYQLALKERPNLETCIEAGKLYLDNEDFYSAKKWYERKLLSIYPREAATYEFGIKLYLTQDNERMAYQVYDDYKGRELSSKKVEKLMKPLKYHYDLFGKFSNVSVFSNNGLAAAADEERWGFVQKNGEYQVDPGLKKAGVFTDYAPVIYEDGKAAYIDEDGNEKVNESFILEKDPEFKHVTEFKPIQSDLILAYNGKIWNYYEMSSYKKVAGGFKDAYPITLGVGAVQNESGKWALIGENGKEITKYEFDEVVADEKDVICRTSAIIVKKDKGYILIDHTGKQIGKTVYEDARAFYEGSYAAVKKNGSWIFVDESGKEQKFGKYEDAKSFSNGLAAVKVDGYWGYIDPQGKEAIACEFLDAKPFSAQGVAFVKVDENNWKLLSLYIYNHD